MNLPDNDFLAGVTVVLMSIILVAILANTSSYYVEDGLSPTPGR